MLEIPERLLKPPCKLQYLADSFSGRNKCMTRPWDQRPHLTL